MSLQRIVIPARYSLDKLRAVFALPQRTAPGAAITILLLKTRWNVCRKTFLWQCHSFPRSTWSSSQRLLSPDGFLGSHHIFFEYLQSSATICLALGICVSNAFQYKDETLSSQTDTENRALPYDINLNIHDQNLIKLTSDWPSKAGVSVLVVSL